MFNLIKKDSLQIFWIIFHALLGFGAAYNKWVLIGWFAIITLAMILALFIDKRPQHIIIFYLCYAISIEVLARGAQAYPYIPDQMGKYMGIIMFSFGLALGGPIRKASFYGAFMLLLSLPGLTIAPEYSRAQIVFNYFGPLALFLGVMFCSRQIITFTEFKHMARFLVLPIISLACFVIQKSAQIEKIDYGLTANFDAAGGSITNQVSTLLGLGIAVMFLMYVTQQTLFVRRFIDIGVLGLLAIRGLLTFSRGGMVSALLCIMAVILWPKAKAAWQDSEIRLRKINIQPLLVGVLFLGIVFVAINSYTNNFLLYRYQGKTERAIQTGFDNTLTVDQFTSGRFEIMLSDIRIFLGNPFIGVGVGHSAVVRTNYGASSHAAAHLEISRLLAEHGLPGLMLVVLIYFYPFYLAYREPNNYKKAIMLTFLIMSLSATFHSAMRTMVTPLLFAFAFIKYVPSNFDWQSALSNQKPKRRLDIVVKRPEEKVAEPVS